MINSTVGSQRGQQGLCWGREAAAESVLQQKYSESRAGVWGKRRGQGNGDCGWLQSQSQAVSVLGAHLCSPSTTTAETMGGYRSWLRSYPGQIFIV